MEERDRGWRRTVLRLLHGSVLTAGLALAGCQNAVESLDVGEWREGGSKELPVSPNRGDPLVRDIAAGSGEPVRKGDLVKIRLIVTTPPSSSSDPSPPAEPVVVWVWTGRDSGNSWEWGHPGAESVRRALVGRRPAERFELAYGPDAEGVLLIPLKGLMEPQLEAYQLTYRNYVYGDRYYHARRWPAVDLRAHGQGPPRVEVEIIAACKAKRLYRTGVMKQWGFMANTGDASFRSSRRGVLRWSALDATCPSSDGHVRMEAGPFYFPDLRDTGGLWNWADTYVRRRPPPDHPLEWEVGRPASAQPKR
jgi:hypothetical protein